MKPLCAPRRRIVGSILALGLLTTAAAVAQDYPSKPIRLVVPVPAGAGPDVDTRQLTARITPILGQVIVENRPGASTRIATEVVAKSAPDGYTFLVGTPSFVTADFLYEKLPYDSKRDLVPVSLLSTISYLLTVNAAVPAQSLAQYVALTKSNQSQAQVGTYGVGTVPHLAGAWFASATGADLKFIHYNTTPPFNDLVAGQTQALFDAMLPVLGNLKAGKLRALAISGTKRHPLMPDTPTFTEAGLAGYDPTVWIGLLAPTGTPRPIIEKVSAAFAQAARTPEIVNARRETGAESIGSTPAEFAAFIDGEREKWGKVIKGMGLKLE